MAYSVGVVFSNGLIVVAYFFLLRCCLADESYEAAGDALIDHVHLEDLMDRRSMERLDAFQKNFASTFKDHRAKRSIRTMRFRLHNTPLKKMKMPKKQKVKKKVTEMYGTYYNSSPTVATHPPRHVSKFKPLKNRYKSFRKFQMSPVKDNKVLFVKNGARVLKTG